MWSKDTTVASAGQVERLHEISLVLDTGEEFGYHNVAKRRRFATPMLRNISVSQELNRLVGELVIAIGKADHFRGYRKMA